MDYCIGEKSQMVFISTQGFGPKICQIGSKETNFEFFSDQDFSTFQLAKKPDLKRFQMCPIQSQSDPFWAQICPLCFHSPISQLQAIGLPIFVRSSPRDFHLPIEYDRPGVQLLSILHHNGAFFWNHSKHHDLTERLTRVLSHVLKSSQMLREVQQHLDVFLCTVLGLLLQAVFLCILHRKCLVRKNYRDLHVK